ncbi:hypothetical protein ACFWNG_03750 [Streptomyces sp. NPDC058391]|uniref:hypothetical protein n=1 Tax=Streptomyces sp. NPDC058391 TaxID=3346476 RepID=UPI0036463CB4
MKQTTTTYKAPPCRTSVGMHSECPGPREVRLASQSADERAIETLRCDCPCHRGGERDL